MMVYFFALDLKNEEDLIREYEQYHQEVWPEIIHKIKESGILQCEIYRVFNRLVMRIETNDEFSFEKKSEIDQASPIVQQWEELMWKYQEAIPGSKPGEKWILMNRIFHLN
ncbi:MAG: L-rhamnose mutarotase [Bacteroidia bacterium]